MNEMQELNSWQYFNRNTKRLLIGSAFVGLTFEGIVLVLFNLYVLRLGYGPEFIGIVNAAGLITFAVVSLLVGLYGEGTRVRRLMLVGLVIIAVGVLLLPVAELTTGSLQRLLIISCNIAYHIGVSCYFVSVPPFIMHNTAGREHINVLSVESAAFSISAFTGSLLGGFLPTWLGAFLNVGSESPVPYRIAFLLTTILLIPPVLIMWGTDSNVIRVDTTVKKPEPNESNRVDISGPARVFVIFVIVMTLVRIIQSAGMNTSFTFFNVYFDEELNISTGLIGLFNRQRPTDRGRTGAAHAPGRPPVGSGTGLDCHLDDRGWGLAALGLRPGLVVGRGRPAYRPRDEQHALYPFHIIRHGRVSDALALPHGGAQ